MSRDWQKDMDMLKEADGWEFESTFDGEGNITKGTTTIAEYIGVSYAGTIFNAFEALKYWLQQYAAEKERSGRLHEEIARINCDYYSDKQRFHDRGRELEEAKERADKAEEREKVLKHAFIVMLGYVPNTARVALDFEEVLASLYPKEETQ